MSKSILRRWLPTLVLAMLGVAASASAWADPPSRVVRLAYTSGAVSFSPVGENDWVRATVNRPLITGDRLWADAAARAELRLGSVALRMGENTSVALLNVDDRIAQLQLAQGILNLRVKRLDRDQVLEIDTPNLAYSVTRPGVYRIEVDPQGAWTEITLRSGEGEVFGEGSAFVVTPGQAYRFYGTNLRDYEVFALAQPDEFDRWATERDRRWDNSASARYMSPEVIGYEDLDAYGHWRTVADYGPVWVPDQVPAGWAPYRDGHWAWIEPWGWTWVDDAPWGYAPSHYGRWARVDQSWAWVPGPITTRPVYAPAVVQFVGGAARDSRASLTIAGVAAVAWFALAPHEVYRPSYQVSRDYLNAVNTSNTVVSETHLTNVYNNTNVTNVYVNQQVSGAVVAVPTTAFAQSKPVGKAALQVTNDAVARAPAAAVAPIAPVRSSLVGAAAEAGTKPPAAVISRAVVAKTPPPPAPAPFAAKQNLLADQAGKPLDADAVAKVKPAAPAVAAPVVKVVTAGVHPAPLPPKPASTPAVAAPRTAQAPASASRAEEPASATRAASGTPTTEPARSAAPPPRPPEPTRPAASAAAPQTATRPVEPARARTPAASEPRPQEMGRGAPAASGPPAADERGARTSTPVPRPPPAARPAASAAAVPPAPRPEAQRASDARSRAASESHGRGARGEPAQEEGRR